MNCKILTIIFLCIFTTSITFAQDKYILLEAAMQGDSNIVKKMIDEGVDVNSTTVAGVTPLMYAADGGHIEIVKMLVEAGAEINKKPDNGTTALISAVKNNHFWISEYLLKQGANPNLHNKEEISPLLYACGYNYFNLSDMLLYFGANTNHAKNGVTPLHLAAMHGDSALIRSLFDYGSDIHAIDSSGFTPLHMAVQNGHFQAVQLLLNQGADVNRHTKNNFSPLDLAAQFGHKKITKVLLEKGADTKNHISKAITPATLARINQHYEVYKLLNKECAETNWRPVFGRLSITWGNNFNFHDYMTGLTVGIHEYKSGFSAHTGFYTRPHHKRILYEIENDTYYQFREWRSFALLGLEKKFRFGKNSYNGLILGAKEIYTFGNYRGSKKKPDDKFIFVPEIGFSWGNKNSGIQISYQYLNFNTEKVSPHRIDFSVYFNINFTVFKAEKRTIFWL